MAHNHREDWPIRNSFGNLDEVAAPPPARSRRPRGLPLEDHLSHRIPANDRNDETRREYNLPNDYGNLDELAAPSPIENPQRDRPQGYLEDCDDRSISTIGHVWRNSEDSGGKDDIAALSVVDNEQSEYRQKYLEDNELKSLSTEGKQSRTSDPFSNGRQASTVATELYTISYLIFFSILGTLARLGLQALTFYPGAPIQTGVLWANVGGSLIMGFLSEDQKLFQYEWGHPTSKQGNDKIRRSPSTRKKHGAVKKTIPLYIGLATGFCGSFTSFSSFIRDTFYSLSNALPVPINHPSSAPISQTINVHRSPGYSVMATMAVLISTVGLSLMGLYFGAHIALAIEPLTPSIPFFLTRKIIDRVFVIMGWGCWLGAVLMSIWPPDRRGGPLGDQLPYKERWRSEALFALVFAPLGCLSRFYVSLKLNGKIPSFPLGTFVVNVFGTAMEAMFLDLQRVPIGGMIGCQVLQGMMDGFCGCLTTISIWVTELNALRLQHAYLYGAMSISIGLSFMVIIAGSLEWTLGFAEPLCIT